LTRYQTSSAVPPTDAAGLMYFSSSAVSEVTGATALVHRDLIIAAAAKHGLPAVYPSRVWAAAFGNRRSRRDAQRMAIETAFAEKMT